MTRPASPSVDPTRIGVLVLALAALAAAGFGLVSGEEALAGIGARIGVILGAVWLAWPGLRRVSLWTALLVLVGIGVLLWRPRTAVVVLPVLALLTRTRGS